MSKPNKTEQLLAFIRGAPGTPLKRLIVESHLPAKFVRQTVWKLLRSHHIHGDRLKGYTVADDLPPKQRGFRAEARDARRAARVARGSKGLPASTFGAKAGLLGIDHNMPFSLDSTHAWRSPEAFMGFLVGSAIDRLARHVTTGSEDDLREAGRYLDRAIALVSAK